MDDFMKMLPALAREETRPAIPAGVRWKAYLFGRQKLSGYLWNYYREEAQNRRPFYLPCIYMREEFNYLRRYARIARKQVSAVLVDGNDARSDYFLQEFLGQLNYLTIVSERKAYFEGLAERAFQELGLLIDLVFPWEEKALDGNLVWDLSNDIQKEKCYPAGSICFVPSKSEKQCQELKKRCPKIIAAGAPKVLIGTWELPAALAETLLVPKDFPFRQSRCAELRRWCADSGWHISMSVFRAAIS